MSTGSSHSQRATNWLAEIDQVKINASVNVGSVFGSYMMPPGTLDVKCTKGLVKTMTPEFKRQIQLAEEIQEKKNLPMLTEGRIAFIILACLRSTRFRGELSGMNGLPNKLANDNLKTFEEAWRISKWHGRRNQKSICSKAFAVDTWRSKLACRLL